jgi:fucose 4-O-acetylase-like acetyltransferase
MSGESGKAIEREDGRADGARIRLDWLDALKGIGIIAVVAGHVWTRGPVRDAIYAVHMPLFFMISGYTARAVPWRVLLPAMVRGLLVPFLCFAVLLLAADFLIEGLRGVRPIFPGWLAGVRTILLATDQTRGPFTVLWFIPALLLARLAWNAIAAGGRRPSGGPMLLTMAAVLGLALLAARGGMRSPFGAVAVPGALLMIWAGALWRQWGDPSRPVALALAGLAVLTLAAFPPLNMKQGDLGWPVLSLAGAGAVTVTLAGLAPRFPPALMRMAVALGRASLTIMYVHVAMIHYLTPYAPKLLLFAGALAASGALDWLIRRTRWTRRLLLGDAKSPVKSIDS